MNAGDVEPGQMVREQDDWLLVTAKTVRGPWVDLSLEGLDYTYATDEPLAVR